MPFTAQGRLNIGELRVWRDAVFLGFVVFSKHLISSLSNPARLPHTSDNVTRLILISLTAGRGIVKARQVFDGSNVMAFPVGCTEGLLEMKDAVY